MTKECAYTEIRNEAHSTRGGIMKRVLIVGLGLLGGSYARGLSKKDYDVTAIDSNPEAIAFGLEHKMISAGSVEVDVSLIAQAELIVFAVYPELMLDWVQKYQNHMTSGTVITDVLGVKGNIVTGMEAMLRSDLHFVGAHPMAGKEVSGVQYADETMFHKANFILTPTDKTDSHALKMVETMAQDLEFRQISILSPEEHDKAIGFLSQLTHVIAVSLMNCKDNEQLVKYTGDSFRDLTRIAMINENLWSQLFISNKEILLEEIDSFVEEMQDFRHILETEDMVSMKEKFVTSTERRKKFIQ